MPRKKEIIEEPYVMLNLRLPESVRDRLEQLARDEMRTISSQVTWMLVQEVKRRGEE